MIRVELICAWPQRFETTSIELAAGAQVGHALQASGWMLDEVFVGLAIFGRAASLQTLLSDGDRIELLRALELDPKQARRRRAGRLERQD